MSNGWKVRAIEALKGNQSLPGCILLAALGKSQDMLGRWRTPSFGMNAVVSREGVLCAPYLNRDGVFTSLHGICKLQEAIDAFRRLADTLKLTTAEADEMFAELRKWIKTDLRPQKTDTFEPIPAPKAQH